VAVAAVRVRDRFGAGQAAAAGGAGRVPQVHPFLLAVPAFGQVEGEVASSVAGGAGGDSDQVTADRRGAGLREREAGQGAGRADQVMGHRRDGQPGGIRGEAAGGYL